MRATKLVRAALAAIVLAGCGGRSLDSSTADYGDASAPEARDAAVDSTRGDDAANAPIDASAVDGDAVDADDATVPFDAPLDAPQLAPCLSGHYVFFVQSDNGAQQITEQQGTWSSQFLSESFLQINVDTASRWALAATADIQSGESLHVGTYASQGNAHATDLVVVADGVSCSAPGTFTIYELVAPLGDQSNVTRLLMDFDLGCGASAFRGCLAYGR
jgi:hypothetical protein